MTTCCLLWGFNPIKKKYYKKAEEVLKNEVFTTYCTNSAILQINKSGVITKEGRLNWEKKVVDEENRKVETITLRNFGNSYNFQADYLSVGDNHILILTKNNLVFSWGDNYYGQLGLNNYLVPLINQPQIVRVNNINFIFCFKNNSFAIDGSFFI